mgnify:CR=1 FL=1|tara:strand:- start:385 stop:687 length:303 start_codon:yes stop_codon:yes gene_type:complete
MKVGDTGYYSKRGWTVQEQIDDMFRPNPFDGSASDSVIWMQIRETMGIGGLADEVAGLKDLPAKEGKVRITAICGKIVDFEWLDGSGIGQSVTDRVEPMG